jgi:hypothetical protein
MVAPRLPNPIGELSYIKMKNAGLLDKGFQNKVDNMVFIASGDVQPMVIGGPNQDSVAHGSDVVNLKGIGSKTAHILKSREFNIQTIGALAHTDANFDRAMINDLSKSQRAAVNALRTALQSCYIIDHPPPL